MERRIYSLSEAYHSPNNKIKQRPRMTAGVFCFIPVVFLKVVVSDNRIFKLNAEYISYTLWFNR
ncbi:MAG: hypothetical protein IPO04_00955 [Cytophagaceae bacterium]|nr:hypothetical protein [Cytophagaceae bacterium]